VAGDTYHSTTGSDFAVTRLNSDGSLDASFGTAGVASVSFGAGNTNDVPCGMALDAAGRIVVAGSTNANTTSYDFAVTRLNSDGSLDAGFGTSGEATVSFGTAYTKFASGMTLDGAGRIVVVGATHSSTGFEFALTRLNSDGSLDSGFGAGGK